nr:MAG TPA: hypothetical protein [Caudoviricetes sp.]
MTIIIHITYKITHNNCYHQGLKGTGCIFRSHFCVLLELIICLN